MQQANAAAPNDGRIRYANYTKNVLIWYSDADAARFVNEFQQVVSSDFYWFTDPYQVPTMEAPDWLPEAGQTITTPQIRRAANYGYQIDRMRQLDALDGKRQPIWGFVEEGWPFTQTAAEGARAITPPQMRAAVWQSLIAGARGIVYFNHSFGGPCLTHYINRDPCYPAIQAELTRTNSQITQLAPVLNSPTVSSGWSQRSRDDRDGEVGQGQEAELQVQQEEMQEGQGQEGRRGQEEAMQEGEGGCGKVVTGKGNLFVFAGSAGSSVEWEVHPAVCWPRPRHGGGREPDRSSPSWDVQGPFRRRKRDPHLPGPPSGRHVRARVRPPSFLPIHPERRSWRWASCALVVESPLPVRDRGDGRFAPWTGRRLRPPAFPPGAGPRGHQTGRNEATTSEPGDRHHLSRSDDLGVRENIGASPRQTQLH